MAKSTRLTADQIRLAMRAVGECRDVGNDPAAWNMRIASFFMEQLRSVFTSCFTLRMAGSVPTVEQLLFTLWRDNRLHSRWVKFTANHRYRIYTSVQRFSERYAGEGLTLRRQDLIADREWLGSSERSDRITASQEELLLSAQPHEHGLSHVFSLNRADGDEPFTLQEKYLVRLVHEELGLLFGVRLSLNLASQALPGDLTPRLQAVFVCLLSGDSDKQIAGRIGLSVHTVHEYVTALYRRFDVHSRAELFALANRNAWMPGASPPK